MCVCFCEFKGMFTCLSQTTWGKKEGKVKGAKLGLSLSLSIYYSPSLSPLPIVTRSTENILRDFLPFKTKSWTPPSPITPPVGMLRSEQCRSWVRVLMCTFQVRGGKRLLNPPDCLCCCVLFHSMPLTHLQSHTEKEKRITKHPENNLCGAHFPLCLVTSPVSSVIQLPISVYINRF